MKSRCFRLGELAERVGGRVVGDPERAVNGVATLESAGPGDLAFLTNPRYRKLAESTRAGAVLVGPGTMLPDRDILEVPEPYLALAEILEAFHPPRQPHPGVSPDSRVATDARIGDDVEIGAFAVIESRVSLGNRCVIGPGSVVGEGCVVGDDSILAARVVLYPGTRVGSRCLLHSGVVLGADGFGFATSRGRHRKIPQVGRVVLEDDVEIGANSAVDRGAIGDTVVGQGTKIDDLVMVAHGVRVGPHCLLVGQSGIAGSSRLGIRVTLAGQSGISGHLEIGDDAIVAAKSAVFEDVPPRSYVAGIPATDHRAWKRSVVQIGRLSSLRDEVRALQRRLVALEEQMRERDKP